MTCLYKLILSTNKMAVAAKQDVQSWKKKLCLILSHFFLEEKWIKPDLNYPVKSFNFPWQCSLCTPIILFMASKKRYNLCMNRALLDRESLNRVLWNSATLTKPMAAKYWKPLKASKQFIVQNTSLHKKFSI